MKDLLLKAPLTRTVLLLMLAGLLLALILPKADFSEMENRVLATVDLRAGQLDRQLENYLADHFPFHDAAFAENVVIAVLGVGIGEGGLKPGMLRRGMIHREIQDPPDAALMARLKKLFKVLHGSELRIDGQVVRGVVLMIGR